MKKDVVIVGSGISALSAALHLRQKGIENIEIILDDQLNYGEKSQPETSILSGYFDQITRIEHAFGGETTKAMYGFSKQAYALLKLFCNQHQITLKEGKVKRVGVSSAEKEELCEAQKLYQAIGYDAKSLSWERKDIHFTGEMSLSLPAKELIDALKTSIKTSNTINSTVTGISEDANGISIELSSGQTRECEFLILANHHRIGDLIPFYESVLIPYSDQWTVAMCDEEFLESGELALLNYSNIWVKSLLPHQYVFGGARYARKNAGVGDKRTDTSAKANTIALSAIADTFNVKFGQTLETTGFTGVRACDEMPVIGPHFGNGRILLCAGFMSNALPMGFLAGRCLAEIISDGKSTMLPRCFTPERLRTLAK